VTLSARNGVLPRSGFPVVGFRLRLGEFPFSAVVACGQAGNHSLSVRMKHHNATVDRAAGAGALKAGNVGVPFAFSVARDVGGGHFRRRVRVKRCN